MTFVAPCLLGLEGLVANEFKFLGFENVRAENGRVLFDGDYTTMVRANICSHYADRIMILLKEFRAVTFEELFSGVYSIDFENIFSVDDKFPVKGGCISSKLNSVPACQKIIKMAMVKRMQSVYKDVEWFSETGKLYQIRFLLFKDKVSIMLDTSGQGLNKRGYRAVSNEAPIKETLAAAMVDLSRVRNNHLVIDPFCGSGTILIEAAMKAKNIMPGINRSFVFESWGKIDTEEVEKIRQEYREKERKDITFKAFGFDIDKDTLKIAKDNAKIANVDDVIEFSCRDIRDYEENYEFATVITNPPYGERMMELDEVHDLYKIMGEKFKRRDHHSYTVISPDEDFEKIFGRDADKRRKLYNGMIKCNVFMYYK